MAVLEKEPGTVVTKPKRTRKVATKKATVRKAASRKVTAARSTRKSSGAAKVPAPATTVEERQQMIAEAAYYLAERRGFTGGDPTQDWLKAEADINAVLVDAKARED